MWRHFECCCGGRGLTSVPSLGIKLLRKTFEDCAVRSGREPFPAYYIRSRSENCPARECVSFAGSPKVNSVNSFEQISQKSPLRATKNTFRKYCTQLFTVHSSALNATPR